MAVNRVEKFGSQSYATGSPDNCWQLTVILKVMVGY